MSDREPEHVERGVLLTLFVMAVMSVGIVVACTGWGTSASQ